MQNQPRLHPSPVRSAFLIDKAAAERFLSHCIRKTYPAKQNIFSPGDNADTLYYVISGSLAIVSEEKNRPDHSDKSGNPPLYEDTNIPSCWNHKTLEKFTLQETIFQETILEDCSEDEPEGQLGKKKENRFRKGDQELVLGYVNQGEFVGELGLFLNTSTGRHVSFRTRSSSEIAEIKYDHLLQLMKDGELAQDCPKILYTIGIHLSKRLFSVSRKASSLAFVDVTERILRTIFELAQQPDALTHPQGMQIKASRQELARLSGCSREMAGRALKQLEEDKKLTAHGKTIVLFCER